MRAYFRLYLMLGVLSDIALVILLFLGNINLIQWFLLGSFLQLYLTCYTYGIGAKGLADARYKEEMFKTETLFYVAVYALTLVSVLFYGWQTKQFATSLLLIVLTFLLSKSMEKFAPQDES